MRQGTIKSTWAAPRWAKVSSFIKDVAFELGLECEVDVDKGLIRERGRFKVSGDENALRLFKKAFESAAEKYNS